jgi:hypothetical protein
MLESEHKKTLKPQEQAIDLDRIEITPLARSLMDLPGAEPYLAYIECVLLGTDSKVALQKIRALPFEDRYTSRIVGALAFAFADFDSMCIEADKLITTPSERDVLLGSNFKLRPFQFCIFLRALLGPKEMERIMNDAIELAKTSSP